MLPEQLFLTLPPLLPEQENLQPPVVTVVGNIEYRTWRERLERIHEILQSSRTEEAFIRLALKRRLEQGNDSEKPRPTMCAGDQVLFQRMASMALRTTLARVLVGGSYRDFSARLADSPLLQWFCRLNRLGAVHVPGKSQLQEYQALVDESELREVIDTLVEAAAQKAKLSLRDDLDLTTAFLDSTCVKLNIHYPTDWVLLRDAARTLLKATILIRRRGLKIRMREPREFSREMNALAMEMTREARRAGNRKGRKRVLRRMKQHLRRVEGHARRHRDLLEKRWQETEFSAGQAKQIVQRMDTILERLPWVIRQAHERIIGERQVANEEKILSLYEGHAAVYVRGKAGAEVEFGSQLLLAEAECGLITDWELVCGNPESDMALLKRSLQRQGSRRVQQVVADRGFDSKATRQWLAERHVINGIAPRDPYLLRMRLHEPGFSELQQRRGQTEARIAIFKNAFLGSPILAKGHRNQARCVAWNVLTHDLWLLAGLQHVDEHALLRAG